MKNGTNIPTADVGKAQIEECTTHLTPTQRHLEPFAILINKGPRPLDRELAGKGRIALQKSIDSCIIARRYAPLSILTNQILLHNKFSVAIERFGDVSIHSRFDDGDVS